MHRIVSGVGILLLCGSAGRADCIGGSRPATAAENQYDMQVVKALAEVVPPAPAGWTLKQQTALRPIGVICLGQPASDPYTREYVRVFEWTSEVVRRGQKQMEVVQAMTATPTWAKIQEIAKKASDAMGRGDAKEVQRLVQEQRKYNEAHNAAVEKASEPYLPKDTSARITIAVNRFEVAVSEAQPAAIPGAAFAFRSDSNYQPKHGQEGETFAALGNWQSTQNRRDAVLRAKRNPGAPRNSIQTVVVTVRAERMRAEALLGQVKWQSLQALLKN